MSGFGVYEGDMARNRISDQEVERLLTRGQLEGSALASLAPLVERIHLEWDRQPTPESISSFARAAADVAGTRHPQPSPTLSVASPRSRLVPRLALPLALVVLISALSGVAVAADDAVPGDALHGVKLALERIGIGRGGVAERFSEANELAFRGQHDVALAHAAAALGESETGDEDLAGAVAGLEDAIAQLQVEVPGASNEVRGRVAEMLQWMVDNAGLMDDPQAEPGAFGKGVAAMARQIAGNRGAPDDGDSSDDSDVTDEGNRGLGGPPKGTPGPPTEGIPPNRP